ncbi:hypothetical protein FACS18948_6640 [Clostridia bacterium]|nr:hypothetical protein FACS18948_6640 [Clostridia bacterium]
MIIVDDESPPWTSFEAGTTLYESGFVMYDGAEWQCLETHKKRADSPPHDDGLFWIRVPPKWRCSNG